ncbi:MAG: 3'-5' exonuclease, partial [Bacteroidota bacterium]
EYNVLVFDTETTGLDAHKDRIISIAGVVVQRNAIIYRQSFEKLIKQEHIGNKESSPIHQILAQDLVEAQAEEEVIQAWLSFTRGAVLVAHQASFDVNIVQHHVLKLFDIPLFNPYIDTFTLARRLDKASIDSSPTSNQGYDLDTLCERFQIKIAQRHTAMGDALATAELFLHLVQHLKERGNHKTKHFIS